MRTVAVYPGRFHVFHRGHQAVYDHLVKQFGAENVYIGTSEKQNAEDSPFSFSDKVTMMTKMGVPPSRIIKVVSPYNIKEVAKTLGLDPEQDRLVYALGAKDAQRFQITDTSALQMFDAAKTLKPVNKHAYIEVVPTATFNVMGQPVQSASVIRKMYADGNENDRNQIIADLYGAQDSELKDIFDQRLATDSTAENIIYGQEKIFAGDKPQSVMRESRLKQLAENINLLRRKLRQLKESQDYIEEKRPSKK